MWTQSHCGYAKSHVIRRDQALQKVDFCCVISNEIKLQNSSVFAKRLKQARKLAGIAQDRLGVLIGLDEHTASARISRYESGIHEPPLKTSQLLAQQLAVPLAFLYCEDDRMARILLMLASLTEPELAEFEIFLTQKTVSPTAAE